eukprot:6173890-Pleurochrysis_carterae.AAC.1
MRVRGRSAARQDEEVMEQLARTMASLVTPSGVCLLAYEFRDDWLSAGNFQERSVAKIRHACIVCARSAARARRACAICASRLRRTASSVHAHVYECHACGIYRVGQCEVTLRVLAFASDLHHLQRYAWAMKMQFYVNSLYDVPSHFAPDHRTCL